MDVPFFLLWDYGKLLVDKCHFQNGTSPASVRDNQNEVRGQRLTGSPPPDTSR